jgi:branched-subunit amino acid aminotransferase/4-amino-4-deoxychorismate lyase
MVVAKDYLGLEVEEREVYLDELKDFAECGLCGTAAVISPVGKVVDHGKEICFPSGMSDMGPVTKQLYDFYIVRVVKTDEERARYMRKINYLINKHQNVIVKTLDAPKNN